MICFDLVFFEGAFVGIPVDGGENPRCPAVLLLYVCSKRRIMSGMPYYVGYLASEDFVDQ